MIPVVSEAEGIMDTPDNWAILVLKASRNESVAREIFIDLLEIFTQAKENIDIDGELLVEPGMAGYLSRKVGRTKIYVPLNLSYVSPSADQYSEIVGAMEEFRYRSGCEICLSGSATFLGRTSAVSDIDLAEYYFPTRADALASFDDFVNRTRGRNASIVSIGAVETQKKQWHDTTHPFRKTKSGMALGTWRVLNVAGKADIMGAAEFDVTNKIFPSAAGELAANTYVYQEIVICIDGAVYNPPRSLVEPSHLKMYIRFLLQAAKKNLSATGQYLEKGTIKALKRVMSLSLLLGLQREFDEGLRLLPKSDTEVFDSLKVKDFVRTVHGKVLSLYEEATEAASLPGAMV